jgi:hypothetical protein
MWRHLPSAILVAGAVVVLPAGASGDVSILDRPLSLQPWRSASASGPWPAIKDLRDSGMAWFARGSSAQSASATPVPVAPVPAPLPSAPVASALCEPSAASVRPPPDATELLHQQFARDALEQQVHDLEIQVTKTGVGLGREEDVAVHSEIPCRRIALIAASRAPPRE